MIDVVDIAGDLWLTAFVLAVGTILLWVFSGILDQLHRPPTFKVVDEMLEPEEVIAVLMFSDSQIERIRDAYCNELSAVALLISQSLPPSELVEFVRNLNRGPVTIRERERQPLMAFAERRDLPWLAWELMRTDPAPRFVSDKPPLSPKLESQLKAFYGDVA